MTPNRDDDAVDEAFFVGDEILIEMGRKPDENGEWSDEDLELLWDICQWRNSDMILQS